MQDIVDKLKKLNLWESYKKDIKSIKYGWITIIISSSIIFSYGLVHSYQGLEESKNLYQLSFISYLVAWVYKRVCISWVNRKYKKNIIE